MMKKWKIWQLVTALVVVIAGTVIFVGAVSGWFNGKVTLDAEYLCDECSGEFVDIDADKYEEMVNDAKSFVLMVDQNGCSIANKLRGFAERYSVEHGVVIQRIMFDDMKQTSLKQNIRYYPSMVIVSRGKVVDFLKSDSDEHAEIYNNYDAFEGWMGKYL